MNENDDPVAAFGSAEEGNDPLKTYIDPTLFDTLDRQAQIELLTPAFDAITLAGADYDIKAQDSATGKRYTLLKDKEVIDILVMDSSFTDQVIESINKNQEDD
ncbi:hypothetical protein [Psychrobacter sp. P2G3]|uniref:hypothetical protein n=1 Tax=Psychrobacter sp. P2G3 TaxID=1699622 RepID=UPI00078E2B24|nr:hypothetical protein [Psychrobacter sp. P2G3]AMN50014.1 hypothetical protein AK823_09130 [Psychrobacter sp. P2G3]